MKQQYYLTPTQYIDLVKYVYESTMTDKEFIRNSHPEDLQFPLELLLPMITHTIVWMSRNLEEPSADVSD